MSVLSCEELWSGRRAKDGIERIREYTRRFEVIVDSASDDGTVAGGPEAGNLGLPRNGDPYPNDPDAVMVSIEPAASDDSPFLWYVDCHYSSKTPDALASESQAIDQFGNTVPTDTAPGPDQLPRAQQRDPNPINWTPVWKVTHEQVQEPLTHDYLGNEIVNSAGDPYYPPLTIERSYAVFTVEKNYAQMKFEYLQTYVDTVNLEPFRGLPARTCRMIAIEWQSQESNGYSYLRVTFRIKFKPGEWDSGRDNDVGQGWDLRIIDQGFRTRAVTDAGPPPVYRHTDITDPKTGEKPERPQLLDGAGGKHPTLLSAVIQTPPKYVTWEVYKRRDWAGIGI